MTFKLTFPKQMTEFQLKVLRIIFLASSIGDKGYISQKLTNLLKDKGLELITKVRRNTKPKFLSAFDKALLRKRSVIEFINDQLKNISQIEHTRHRSIYNFMTNIITGITGITGITAYNFQPKKPSINMEIINQIMKI